MNIHDYCPELTIPPEGNKKKAAQRSMHKVVINDFSPCRKYVKLTGNIGNDVNVTSEWFSIADLTALNPDINGDFHPSTFPRDSGAKGLMVGGIPTGKPPLKEFVKRFNEVA